jgi:hypothetical protein
MYTLANSQITYIKFFDFGNGMYQVEIPDSGQRHIVTLEENRCDCEDLHVYQSPSSHSILAARYETKDLIGLVYHVYETARLRASYRHPLVPNIST